MKLKYILKAVYLLTIVQLLRVALKNICFLFVTPTMLSNNCFNAIFMIFVTIFIIQVMKKYNYNVSLKIKDYKPYLISGGIIFLVGILTMIITKQVSYENFVLLLYNMMVLSVFEEIIFRSYLWDRAKKIYKDNIKVLLITTLLFVYWQIGYIDSIIMNAILNNTDFTFNTILWKLLIGLGTGLLYGFERIRTKNSYSSILSHSLINIFIR